MQFCKQVPNEEFLPQGEALGIDTVMVAAGKKPHQAAETRFIKIFGRVDAGRQLQDIPVFFIGEFQLPLNNMDNGQFFMIDHIDALLQMNYVLEKGGCQSMHIKTWNSDIEV